MYAPPIHDPYGSDGIPGSVAYYQPPLTHDVNLMYGHNVMVPHPTHIPVLAAVDSQYPVKESRRSHRDRSPPPPPRWAETSPRRESLGRESRHSPSRRSRLSPVKSDRRGSGGGDYKSSRRDIRSRSPPRNKHSRSPPRKRQDRVGQDRASLERGKGRVKDEEEELERLATTPGEIRVRNLPPRTLQREVDALFTWHIGDVTYVEVTDSDGTKAYVKFKTLDHAKRAVDKMYDFNFNDHLIKVYETTEDARKRYEDLRVKRNVRAGPIDWGHTYGLTTSFLESLRIEPPLVPTVFVENVDLIVTPFKLSEVFNLAGRVRNVVLSYDDQCRSKGEAKVEFEHPVEAVQAISMLNGQMLLDRKLKVTMYHEPPPDKLKFPDGLKGVGLGLGQDGAPLRDIPRACNVPSLLSEKVHNVPRLLSEKVRDVPRLLSEKVRDMPRLLSEKIRDVPRVPSEKVRDVPTLLSEKVRDVPTLLSEKVRDVPRVLSEKVRDVPRDCIADVEQAIAHGYSENGKYKLIARKGKCLMKLNKYIDAIKTLNEALNLVEKLEKVPHSKRMALKQDVQETLSSSLKLCRLQDTSHLDFKEDVLTIEKSEENSVEAMSMQVSSTSSSASSSVASLPSLACGESHTLMCASNKIKMQTSNAKGRHVIAVEDVHKGDTLFVEKPVAFVILPPCSMSNCNHCCTSISAPIPCNECILAVYCSESCRREAWLRYHRWECHGALRLLEAVGIAHLALKLILVSSHSDRYKEVYHLETHLQDMRPEDLYQYVLPPKFLFSTLKCSSNMVQKFGMHVGE
ncbi:uncharacterized protein LOC103508296 [Diaphorina citri]|uniref:Uncharacterized protein LOC103508296 n=1 Tax=Diaphorina citri TaxID=121845 RepID=A0A3Q0IQE7_DIACI|nr:uncharacterized protein LOC103508296 [Diaphorina citri]